jgi:hypothetical protein
MLKARDQQAARRGHHRRHGTLWHAGRVADGGARQRGAARREAGQCRQDERRQPAACGVARLGGTAADPVPRR